MYKKFLVLVLAVHCVNTYAENSEKSVSGSEEVAIAQIQAAQKALESMDKRWTPYQLAIATSITGVIGGIVAGYIDIKDPNTRNTVLTLCGTAAAAGTGLGILFCSDRPGSPEERMKLINIIENPQKPIKGYRSI
jgi:hypothetical protein